MICLNMIVKNEAHCIARCLRSVRPYIDAAYICDTGSTDETKAIVRDFFLEETSLPFFLADIPWEGFGPSRTVAAARASEWCARQLTALPGEQRLLFIDADETLEVTGDFSPPDADLVVVSSQYPEGVEGTDRLLARASIPWVFEPITHETIRRADGLPLNAVRWDGARIIEHNDSARRNSGEKNSEDARLLTEWVKDHPKDERAWFYLGQALRNIGNRPREHMHGCAVCGFSGIAIQHPVYAENGETQWICSVECRNDFDRDRAAYAPGSKQPDNLSAAKDAYLNCVDLGTNEHTFFSWLCIGHIEARQGGNPIAAYTRAYSKDRDRAEPLCSLAEWYIGRGDFLTAELYARQACALPEPAYGIFLDRSVYRWKRWSTLGKALCGAGRFREALELHSVDRGEPEEEKARIAAGMAWIREKLGA